MIQLGIHRYDAVVCSTPKAMLLGSIASFFTLQPRRIAWVRGRAYENFAPSKRLPYVALDRIAFRTAHKILFVSKSLMEAYRADGIELGSKGVLLGYGSSNGVDVTRFRPLAPDQRSAARAELGLSAADFLVVMVGRIRKDKGADELLQLLRRLGDIEGLRVIMVGTVEDVEIERAILAQDRQKLECHPDTFDVERVFQCADLHLTLSHREGMSNVALEAAACGVPTFGFDVVGVRDAIVEGQTGELLRFGDLDAVAHAIRQATKEPETFRKKYHRAREVVSERFAQERLWERHENLFVGPAGGDTSSTSRSVRDRTKRNR